MGHKEILINGTIWTVPGHVAEDVMRLVSHWGETAKPAEPVEEVATGTSAELGKKLKESNKKVNALEKELSKLKRGTTGTAGGGN